MGVIDDLFSSLFFGLGGWLGTLLLLALLFGVALLNKYLKLVLMPISVFIGLWYLDNLTVSQNLMWNAIIFILSPIALLVMFLEDKGGD